MIRYSPPSRITKGDSHCGKSGSGSLLAPIHTLAANPHSLENQAIIRRDWESVRSTCRYRVLMVAKV